MADKIKKLNNSLRAARQNRGWPQARLAEIIGADSTMISRWECDARKPEPLYQEKVCSIFQLSTVELEFTEPLNLIESPNNDVQLVKATQITMLNQTMNEKLDHIESIINLAWEAGFTANPKQAAREITRLLPSLEKIIYSSQLSLHVLRASELAIRGHGLLGSVYLDSLQNDMALFHYTQAHTYAERNS